MGKGKGKAIRKRSVCPSTTGNERRKVRCVSAGQAMETVASSVDSAIMELKNIFAVPNNTGNAQSAPRLEGTLKSQAIKAIERDKGLSVDELMDAVLVLENDPQRTDSYLSIEKKAVCTSYLRLHMNTLKGLKRYD
jgi:hypothetical protein